MFLVRNTTTQPVQIKDLNAVVRPHSLLDLEKVASAEEVNNSNDLKRMLRGKRLAVVSHSVVVPQVTPYKKRPAPETQQSGVTEIDAEEIVKMIRTAVMAEAKRSADEMSSRVEDNVKKVTNRAEALMASIRDEIRAVNVQPLPGGTSGPTIDPVEAANLQSKVVEKIVSDLESHEGQKRRGIRIRNPQKLSDLADEIGAGPEGA